LVASSEKSLPIRSHLQVHITAAVFSVDGNEASAREESGKPIAKPLCFSKYQRRIVDQLLVEPLLFGGGH